MPSLRLEPRISVRIKKGKSRPSMSMMTYSYKVQLEQIRKPSKLAVQHEYEGFFSFIIFKQNNPLAIHLFDFTIGR